MGLIPLSPPPGLNSNDTTFSAEGCWADGSNVRFRDGKPQVIGGWASLGSLPSWSSSVVSLGVIRRASGALYLVVGTESELYGGDGVLNHPNTDISPSGLANGISFWSLEPWGSILLACPNRGDSGGNNVEGGKLYVHTPGGGDATEVGNAPDRIIRMLVTQERQVLAFGCNEESSGSFNKLCIRGSDIEDYTVWTTATDNNAFEHILDGVGEIVGAERIGSYLAVWTTTSLYMGQFIGDPGQTYRFDKVDDGCGLIGIAAVAIYNGVAYWMAPDFQIYTWAPGTIPTTVPCPISRDYTVNMQRASQHKTFTTVVDRYGEIWFHYFDTRGDPPSGRTNRYIALNTRDGTWFRGIMDLNCTLTSQLLQSGLTSKDPGSFISAKAITLYHQEHGNTADGSAMSWHIQSADFYLNESQRRMMIRTMIPDFEDQTGDVSVTLYMRDRPHSTAVTKGPYTLTTSTTKKDFRASGKIAAVKFSGGSASGSYVRLGKQLFDTVPMGER